MACDESASIDCARVIRGIDSIANATTPASRSCAIPSVSVSGWRNPTSTVPGESAPIASAAGFDTQATASAFEKTAAASTTWAPASA